MHYWSNYLQKNDVGEKGQRFGSKLIRNDEIEVTNVAEVREKAIQQDSQVGMDQYWNKYPYELFYRYSRNCLEITSRVEIYSITSSFLKFSSIDCFPLAAMHEEIVSGILRINHSNSNVKFSNSLTRSSKQKKNTN